MIIESNNAYVENINEFVNVSTKDTGFNNSVEIKNIIEQSKINLQKSNNKLAEAQKTNNINEKLQLNKEANSYQKDATKQINDAIELKAKLNKQRLIALEEKRKKELEIEKQKDMPITTINNQVITGILFTSPTVENNLQNNNPDNIVENEIKPQRKIQYEQKLPDGLVYKVQVGAFRKPLKEYLFNEMRPLAGEKTPMGFTRYTAGMFSDFNSADLAKEKIREFGYNDAFVVAYLNGKRININQAEQAYNRGENIVDNNKIIAYITNQAQKQEQANYTNNQNTSIQNNIVEKNEELNKEEYTEAGTNILTNKAITTEDFKTNDITSFSGLYYTVQVGAFKEYLTTNSLYGLSPLFYEKLPNGLVRHYFGKYDKIGDSKNAKSIANNQGVRDAFIVAFRNNMRYVPNEETILEFEKEETEKNYQATTPTTNSSVIKQTSNTDKEIELVFKVQIGAYRNQVPVQIVNSLLKAVKDIKIDNHLLPTGITIYTTGNFKTFIEADELKKELVKNGLADAFVTSYKNGVKITVQEAIKILDAQ